MVDTSKQTDIAGRKDKETKLVKATELPLNGNPYPPKDVIIDEAPGFLETKVRNVRLAVQPYMAPVETAIDTTGRIISTGAAHTQSTFQSVIQNENTLAKSAAIAGSGLFGLLLARRGNIFKRLFYASVAAGGVTFALYPEDSGRYASMLWFITKNKLPGLAREQYAKWTKAEAPQSKVNETELQVQNQKS